MRICHFALTLLLSLIFSASVWAAPAAPIEVELSQPDGTTFTVVPRGDEFANWIETTGGHTVVKLNDTWFYAEKDNAGALRATNVPVGSLSLIELQSMPMHLSPEPDPEVFAPTTARKVPLSRTSSGQDFAQTLSISHTQNVLTVLVDYTDQAFTYTDASFQSLVFGASNSVKDFFLQNSYDGYTVTAATESQGTANDGIIHISRAIAHPDQGGDSSISRVEAREVVNLVDSYIDFSAYDTNGNGIVSPDELSIVIILAGYETSYGGEGVALTPNVWGHRWNFASALNLDGVSLQPYTMFGEAHATNVSNEHQATIGIMCHELGHLMLGLPDLYDTDGSSNGIGEWGLMGGGSWNVVSGWSGTSPSHLSAWSKVATGFTVPEDVDSDQSAVSLARADSNEVARRVWIDKYKVFEYFLVENRQQSGYDAGLPASGLLVWHIDDSQTSNRDENHKWVDVEAADGLTQLDLRTNSGDDGDTFPGSTNNTTFNDASTPNSKSYAGTATQISVTGVSASGAIMTADFAAIAGGPGDHVRYDEYGANSFYGLGSTTIWVGVRTQNDTLNSNFDGVDAYVYDETGATIDIYYYTSMAGGTPSGLIYSETGISAEPGWNRHLFSTPQDFPIGEERGIVLKIVNNADTFPMAADSVGVNSGRSYYDSNGVGAFTSFSYDISLVALLSGAGEIAPTATSITPSTTGPTKADSVSFDIIFSKDVVNFNDSADVTITHSGTSNSGVSITGSGSAYAANVTGITGTGSFTLEVNTGSDVEDSTGFALSASVTSASVEIDNTSPMTTVITPSTTGPTSAGSVSFDITFSENVINFADPSDVTITHTGTSHSGVSISGSGSSYSADVTGITGDGGFTIAVNTGSDVQDTVTNALISSVTSATVSIDNTPPAISIGAASAGSVTVGPVSYTVTYLGANAITLADGDVTLNKTGTADGTFSISGEGASSRTVTIINIIGDGTLGISIGPGTATDSAGNSAAAAGPSGTFGVDNAGPFAIIIAPSTTGPTNADSVSFDISFNEDVVNFNDAADVIVSHTGTSHSGVSITGSGSSYSMEIAGIDGDGSFTLAVNTGSDVEDMVTNALGSSVTSVPVSIDNTSPTVSIGTASADSATNGPVGYTITYLEANAVTLTEGDITLNKTGTADGSVAVSGEGASARMVTLSNISGDGTLGISIATGTATDSAGNDARAVGPSGTFLVDNTGPTVTTITPSTTGPTNADSVSFDIAFSEDVVNFNDLADVTISHTGTSHSGVSISGSGSSYTVDVTGIAGDGSFTLEVNTGSDVEDAVSNALSSSVTSEPVNIDNTAPTVSIGTASIASTMRGPVSYTVTYEEADAISLADDDLTLNKTGTADGSVAVSGTGTLTRTVTISNITGDGSLGISTGPGTATDSAGNEADMAGPSGTFSVIFVEKVFEDSFE